jgi:heptosyltransferase-3
MLVKGKDIERNSVRNILLIQLGDIGDVVLSLPALRALHENFPEARIVVAVREKAKELIQDCQWSTDVIAVNEERRNLLEELQHQTNFFLHLRKFNFDIAIDMRTGDREAILALLSGARQRIGFYASGGSFWRNKVFTSLFAAQPELGRHMAEHYMSLLEAYHIKASRIWPEHNVPIHRKHEALALLQNEGVPLDQPIIAVQPFSLWRYKEWGVDKYIQLIRWLLSEYDVSIIITGSPEEGVRADDIASEFRRNVYNLAGKTSIGTLAAVFEACRLFVGVDSAGVHIAAAVGLPTVCIFGPSSYSDWAPRGEDHRIVHKDLPCVPCQNKGCQDSGISRCLEELTVEEVKAVVGPHYLRTTERMVADKRV